MLDGIKRVIRQWAAPNSPEYAEMEETLDKLAKGCGYEKDSEGAYVQFPKQDVVLGKIAPFTIIHEHDDGDLTLDSKTFGEIIVTTDGEIFYKKQIMGVT